LLTAVRNLVKYARRPKNFGYCTICEGRTIFVEKADWLRDHYICIRCASIPRHRALIKLVSLLFPAYRSLAIHESSPCGPASAKLQRECPGYVPTQFYPDLDPGASRQGSRCENLERMTFADESFDLIITQDVLEHVLNPSKAFAEIARTLKPGGAHIFTVPIYKGRKTIIRAAEVSGGIRYLEERVFHGNPIEKNGSLVVTDWGDDLQDEIKRASGLDTKVFLLEDRELGLEAEFLDVLVSSKPLL